MILFLDFDGALHPEGEGHILNDGTGFCFSATAEFGAVSGAALEGRVGPPCARRIQGRFRGPGGGMTDRSVVSASAIRSGKPGPRLYSLG